MIGLPFQTAANLADDLLFFKEMDIDMCGMGPYLEHSETPLYACRHLIPDLERRLDLSLRMVALLRLLMPDINIAATTAMQAIVPDGRERAIMAGANVLMPNLTLSDRGGRGCRHLVLQNRTASAGNENPHRLRPMGRFQALS